MINSKVSGVFEGKKFVLYFRYYHGMMGDNRIYGLMRPMCCHFVSLRSNLEEIYCDLGVGKIMGRNFFSGVSCFKWRIFFGNTFWWAIWGITRWFMWTISDSANWRQSKNSPKKVSSKNPTSHSIQCHEKQIKIYYHFTRHIVSTN